MNPLSLIDELATFSTELVFLEGFKANVFALDYSDNSQLQTANFLAEAIIFRLYRAQERLIRAIFLETCVTHRSYTGREVKSRLSCPDWNTAEEIMKASAVKFLDWGNPQLTTQRAAVIFETGFPITDTISPLHSSLVDLQRIRNFIAHDSDEAKIGFRKAAINYLTSGAEDLSTAGQLLLAKRNARSKPVISILIEKISALDKTYMST